MNKYGQLIEKIIQGTLSKEYDWHKMQGIPMEIASAFPKETIFLLEKNSSYWFKNKSNIIALLSFRYDNYSLFIYSFEDKDFSNIKIPTQSYFRLRTVIQNQLGINEKLLDDFLNS